jgi:hypothetical protein
METKRKSMGGCELGRTGCSARLLWPQKSTFTFHKRSDFLGQMSNY